MLKNKNQKHAINLNLNVRGLSPSATLAINEKCNHLIQSGKNVYKLGLGQSPFPVPKHVVEALQKNAHQKDYLPVKGLPILKESITKFNKKIFNVDCSPDDIMIGPGSKELIFILQLVYYGELIIPTPSWVSYAPQARIVGRNVTWIPTEKENNWRLSPEKLELICRADPTRPRIVILNYPSNPTGCTYPLDRLKLLARVARKYKVILVSDEIYGLTQFDGKHISIAQYYPEGTIISSGLSKWCGAGGWRLGTFTFPQSLHWLLDAMAIVASETYTATSAPVQFAAASAFDTGVWMEEYLFHIRRILKLIGYFFAQKLIEIKVKVPIPEGAFYLFADFEFYREKLLRHEIYTSVEMCNKLLDDTGVAILPGGDFGRQPEELTARIAYVNFDGAKALSVSQTKYVTAELDDLFLKDYCDGVLEACFKICNWFTGL
ncbi:MAG: aminotransferase class I/II-fold pyridoxal phosphate-dependent enzyme [Bacteroidales bacterium]|nr:aminotransferase class I/II-fold pyridoxal phosphate-dependent enzyme [Bacteroidales bacterium]